MAFKYCLVLLVCFLIINPTDAWSLRRSIKRLGKNIKKGIKNVGKAVKKVGCKALFGIVCPAAVGAAAGTLAVGTSGAGTAAVAIGAAAGKHACHVRQKKCKRDADAMLLAFSDNFRDFDTNEDKLISYEEFVFSVMRSVDMADAEELQEPFIFADVNGDDHLDFDEFQAAPFLYAHTAAVETASEQARTEEQTTQTQQTTQTEQTTSPQQDLNVTSIQEMTN